MLLLSLNLDALGLRGLDQSLGLSDVGPKGGPCIRQTIVLLDGFSGFCSFEMKSHVAQPGLELTM